MTIISIKEELDSIGSPFLFYKNFFKIKENTHNNSIILRNLSEDDELYKTLLSVQDAKEYPFCLIEKNFPFIFKIGSKNNKVQWIHTYPLKHLLSSLIKNAAQISNIKEDKRYDIFNKYIIFILYNYNFFRAKTYRELVISVTKDIEDVIKMIILKCDTLYREYPTALMIQSLRSLHRSEKVLSYSIMDEFYGIRC